MAQNVKNKKKKRSNYDDKLIKIIAISLSVAIVAIVAIALVISYSSSYVAKVDGERIMKYEYEYFLTNTMQEMKNDAIEAGTLAEDADAAAIAAFWTADRKKEAENKALEEAKKWKAQYILAKDAGFELSYEERVNTKDNIEYNVYYSYQQYSSYYTFEQFAEMYVGMPLEEYQEIAIQDAAIAAYKAELKKAYTTTDEELKNLYNETPDDYRKITLSVLAMEKPKAPEEVKKPESKKEDGTEKTEDNMSAAEWAEYQDDLREYEEYEKAKKEYDTELKELEDRRNAIIDALKADGKYTEEKKEESEDDADADKKDESADADKTDATKATEATDATDTTGSTETTDATDTADKTTESTDAEKGDSDSNYVYKDATLADIAAKEGALFADNKGEVVINAVSESGHDILDELALTMQWKDENRNTIVSIKDGNEDSTYSGGETVDGITYTQYVAIADDNYFYIVRCIGIEDFDNSKESEAGKEDSIKDQVKRDLYEDKAVAELDAKIAAAGKKYNITSKKQEEIDAIVKAVSWN